MLTWTYNEELPSLLELTDPYTSFEEARAACPRGWAPAWTGEENPSECGWGHLYTDEEEPNRDDRYIVDPGFSEEATCL